MFLCFCCVFVVGCVFCVVCLMHFFKKDALTMAPTHVVFLSPIVSRLVYLSSDRSVFTKFWSIVTPLFHG